MNLNENVIARDRGNAKSKGTKPGFMGPPRKLPPKRKGSTLSSSLHWGKSQISLQNSSAVLRSGGSSKSSAVDSESRIVLALTEGRGDAQCEVGLAVLNVSRPTLTLCQISDVQSYVNTLTKINILNPTEIIVPHTFIDNVTKFRIIDLLKQHFQQIKILFVPRNAFNKSNGLDKLQQLCLPDLKSVLLSLQHKYYALSAASAVLFYAQNTLNVYYCNDTVRINYQESEGVTIIDVWTADKLELVSSTRPAQATKYSTLFGVLNKCLTKIGARTLRSTLLQPPCDVKCIEDRLHCISELMKHPEMLLSVQQILQKISNIDQLLTIATMYPSDEQHCTNRQLNYVLLLNDLLNLVDPLRDIFRESKEQFFTEFKTLLCSQDFTKIRDVVRSTVHKDAHYAKGQRGILERCFMIKSGINGLLDLVRKTYSERLNDMRECVKKLEEKYNLPLTLNNNNTKGYHIVLKLKGQWRNMKQSDLPAEFVQICRLAGSFTMKTSELINLSTRIDDVMTDIIKISNVMICKMLVEIKQYIHLFYNLCECIAKLDMFQSLAQASSGNRYIRPKFGEFTEVKYSVHPMLDFLCSKTPVANSFMACDDFNLHIITGPNGSGKSIFIRQVALLQIMAQIGCYVPAHSAIFRPADRIFARVYMEDNMECGASAFTLEIKEINYIMTTMTDYSLIIIDELCRSTCLEEGIALAMTICEKLANSSAFIYVTTHFLPMTGLHDMYYNIKVWQMETIPSGDTPENTILDFKYTILPGITTLERYGIYLVRNIWPESVVKQIDKMINKVSESPKIVNCLKLDKTARLKYELESSLQILKSLRKLTHTDINNNCNAYFSGLEKLDVTLSFQESVGNNFQYLNSSFENSSIRGEENGISTAFNKSICDENLEIIENRMIENFTPEVQSFDITNHRSLQCQNFYSAGLSAFQESFIPQSNLFENQNVNDAEECSDRASYQDLSEFINENSDNINKLVPDVIIRSENSGLEKYFSVPEYNSGYNFTFNQKQQIHDIGADICNGSSTLNEEVFSLPLIQSGVCKTSTPLVSYNKSQTDNENILDLCGSRPELKTSTSSKGNEFKSSSSSNKVWGTSVVNRITIRRKSQIVSNSCIQEAIDYLQSYSKSFFEDDFEGITSLYKSSVERSNSALEINNNTTNEETGEYADMSQNDSNSNEFFSYDEDRNLNDKSSSFKECVSKQTSFDESSFIDRSKNLKVGKENPNESMVSLQPCPESETTSHNNSTNNFQKLGQSCPLEEDSINEINASKRKDLISKYNAKHIFPKVIVNEGPNNKTISFGSENDPEDEYYYSRVEMELDISNLETSLNRSIEKLGETSIGGIKTLQKILHSSEEIAHASKENTIIIEDRNVIESRLDDEDNSNLKFLLEEGTKILCEASLHISNKSAERSNQDAIRVDDIIPGEIEIDNQNNDMLNKSDNMNDNKNDKMIQGKVMGENLYLRSTSSYVLANELTKKCVENSTNKNNNSTDIIEKTCSDFTEKAALKTKKCKASDTHKNGKNIVIIEDIIIKSKTNGEKNASFENSKDVTKSNSENSKCINISSDFSNQKDYSNIGVVNNTSSHMTENINSDSAVQSPISNFTEKAALKTEKLKACDTQKNSKNIIIIEDRIIKSKTNIKKSLSYKNTKGITKSDSDNSKLIYVSSDHSNQKSSLNLTIDNTSTNIRENISSDIAPERKSQILNETEAYKSSKQVNKNDYRNDENSSNFPDIIEKTTSDITMIRKSPSSCENQSSKSGKSHNITRKIIEDSISRTNMTSDATIIRKSPILYENESSKSSKSDDITKIIIDDSITESRMKTDISESCSVFKSLEKIDPSVSDKIKETTRSFDNLNKQITINDEKNYENLSSSLDKEEEITFSSKDNNISNKSSDERITSTSSMKESSNSSIKELQSTEKKLKRKFKPPKKADDNASSDETVKPNRIKKQRLSNRFIPAKRLTKREIEEEFSRQDRIFMTEASLNPTQSSKYLQKLLNRPSVSQVQQTEHLALIRKTEDGIVVIPAEGRKPCKRKSLPLSRTRSADSISVSIFSDKNAKAMEKFLTSKERNYKLFNFSLIEDTAVEVDTLPQKISKNTFDFQPQTLRDRGKLGLVRVSSSLHLSTQVSSVSEISRQEVGVTLTPDCYYKENKSEIENIMSKYLNRNQQYESSSQKHRNIFETSPNHGDFVI